MSNEFFNFEDLKGHTLTYVEVKKGDNGDLILFRDNDGTVFEMYHDQDCCESVWLRLVGRFSPVVSGGRSGVCKTPAWGQS